MSDSKVPDPDAEREVDLRSAWTRITARWYLPVAGLVIGAILGVLASASGGEVFRGRTLLPLPAHPPPHDEAWRVAGSNPIGVGRKFAAPEREQADAILFCSPPKTLIILFALVSKLSRPLVLPINGADYGLKRGISPTTDPSAPVGPR